MKTTWIKVVNEGMEMVLDAIKQLKGRVVVIGNMVQVSGINKYDERQVKILNDNNFTMIEEYELEARY